MKMMSFLTPLRVLAFVSFLPFLPVRAETVIEGCAVPGGVVVSCTGEFAECGPDGTFRLVLPFPGVYAFKAMADDYADAYIGLVKVPEDGPLHFKQESDPGRRVVRGRTEGPAHLSVTADGQPVRAFDVAGRPLGGFKAPKGSWHSASRNFYSWGPYAFTEKSNHTVRVRHEYAELRARGWRKGDFHAHIIHRENFYRANLLLMTAIVRAEGYDWIYFAQNYANDGGETDPNTLEKLCRELSAHPGGPIVSLNTEWPKNATGHFASFGAGRANGPADPWRITSFELLKASVWDRGGVAVPVHPIYNDRNNVHPARRNGPKISWMVNKEMFLWLACEPDMCCALDLFYNAGDTARALRFWGALLDRGYRIAVTGTSDAAFDVGRTPGTGGRPATFARMDDLSFPSVVRAFKERRTMVSYEGAGVVIDLAGKTSGDILSAPIENLTATVSVYDEPGSRVTVHLVRGGRKPEMREVVPGPDGRADAVFSVSETHDSWLLAWTSRPGREHARAVASPVYFRTPAFRPPEKIPFPQPFPEALREELIFQDPDRDLTDLAFFDRIRDRLRAAAQ